MMADLMTSARPSSSRSRDSVRSAATSPTTATGGQKAPAAFLAAARSTATLPPMAASDWASQVVGTSMSGTPRRYSAAAVPTRSPVVPPPTAIQASPRSARMPAAASSSRSTELIRLPRSPAVMASRRSPGSAAMSPGSASAARSSATTTGTPVDRRSMSGSSVAASRSRPYTMRASRGPIGWSRRVRASNSRRATGGAHPGRPRWSWPRSARCPPTPPGRRRPRRTARARPAGARVPRSGRRRPAVGAHRNAAAGCEASIGRIEPDHGPGIPQRPAAQRVDDRAATRRDDGARHRHRAGHLGGLHLPEPRLAVALDDARGRATGPRRDLGVDVHERPGERLRDQLADAALAGRGQTHEHDRVRHRRRPRRSGAAPARIASMGAGTPSHSSRLLHAWPRSMPAPARAAAPAARASRTRRVGLGR